MQEIIKYTLLFFFYSFGGWCLESTYCSIGEKKTYKPRLFNRSALPYLRYCCGGDGGSYLSAERYSPACIPFRYNRL